MTTRLLHRFKFETLYLFEGVKYQPRVIWGHRGEKVMFTKNAIEYYSSMLQGMAIRLIHVHKLETLYLCYGVKCQPGAIWGHSDQILIFTKNALTLLFSYYIHVTHMHKI